MGLEQRLTPIHELPELRAVFKDGDIPLRLEVREGVEEILEQHTELRAFVRDVAAKLKEMFGEGLELALERFHDPGALGEEDRLFLFVRTDLDPEAAQAMLTRFDEAWWLASSHRGGNLLQVSVEFL